MNLATGQNLIKQKKFHAALNYFNSLLVSNPNNNIYFYLGRVHTELQDYKNGIKFYKKHLNVNENSLPSLINLAILYLNLGDKKNSQIYFKKVLKIDRNYIYAYYGLYTLSKDFINEKDFKFLSKIIKEKQISNRNKSLINFLFSKREKNKNNIEKELFYIEKYHQQSFESNLLYNKQSQFYYENVLGKFYNKINFSKKSNCYKNATPIFIIGLPRSGSTLLESLITSGTQEITTYGESNFFNMAILEQLNSDIFEKEFKIKNFNYDIDLMKIENSINERYNLKKNFNQEFIFLDKSLENLFNIEIILQIFPKAKFIHTNRNLKDAILSIYFSMLPELSWTHSLKTIKNYIKSYQLNIAYFKEKFTNKIFEVNLDEFTLDPERISKDIFNFCELNWNKEILNFYNRKDLFSKTLSAFQIRNEINKKNQSEYKKYYFLLN